MSTEVKRRVLVVGDGVVATGFAKANHAYCAGLQAAGYDVHMLAMHHTGDPHDYPYPIYTSWPGGDPFGIGRITNMVRQVQPDAIIITQDPWNFPQYFTNLQEFADVPVIGIVAVDGKCCQGDKLGPLYDKQEQIVHPGLSHAIFWTKFGANEARDGGWRGKSTVVPLGVDLNVFHPQDKAALRAEMLHPVFEMLGMPLDSFVVGSVGRNQPRKRLDLTIQYFAEWTQRRNIKDACLLLHAAPTGDSAYDLKRLADYFGVPNRVIVPEDINPRYGVREDQMARIYNIFDVFLLTGLGEGWSLPTIEAMACGVPCVVPDWSALGEWAKSAAWLCECPITDVAPNIQTVGGRVGPEVIEALGRLYREPHSRKKMTEAGLQLVNEPQYRWEHIGLEVAKVVSKALDVNMIEVTAMNDSRPRFVQSEAHAV